MGPCVSTENIIIDLNEWDQKTCRSIHILVHYQDRDVNFSNTYQSILKKDMTELKKFAEYADPYMHYTGKSYKKKEKLKIRRLSKTKEELCFLINIWDIYLIAQRLESWNLNDISTNKVNETIELFFVKHREITKFLEDNYLKNI